LLTTFGATLVRDLTTGIVLGCAVAAILSLARRRIPEEGI
jgi:SulP family sulfate permease